MMFSLFLDSASARAFSAVALVLCAVAPVSADESRLTPPLVLSGEVGDGFWAYGQFNKGVLVYDDGDNTDAYFPVDNANSSTRAGLWYKHKVAEDLTISANVEAQWTPYSTSSVNQLNSDDFDWSTQSLRKAETIFDLGGFGKIWVGQGAMASDGSAEVDLSGTSLVAYSSVSDTAGGQRLVETSGAVSMVTVGAAFSNYDGLGRRLRVRYDSPSFHGFSLRTSTGKDAINGRSKTEWDVAGAYGETFGSVKVQAALAYSRPHPDRDRISGSASALHTPTGLNVTIAAATEQRRASADPSYLYGKLGWRTDLIEAGKTSFSVDYYSGDDIAEPGSESTSYSIAAVQSVPAWQTDFYATVRWYEYDAAPGYNDSVAVLLGGRFSF